MSGPLVFDLETGPPHGDPTPIPDDWLNRGVKDNFKADTIERYQDANRDTWPKEWRRRASLDWRVGRIVCAGIGDGATVTVLDAEDPKDEITLVRAVWASIANARPLAGFSIRTFDIPWLVGRSLVLGVVPSRILSNVPRWKTEALVDCHDLLSDRPVAGWGLAAYATLLGLPTQPIGTGAEVASWIEQGDFARVLEHCRADITTTWHLYQRCRAVYGV